MNRKEYTGSLYSQYKKEPIKTRIIPKEEILFNLKNISQLLTLDVLKPDYTYQDRERLVLNRKEGLLALFTKRKRKDPEKDAEDFLCSLGGIRTLLLSTIKIIREGDPASDNDGEIVATYPGFKAILCYRIGHLFYQKGRKEAARVISEYAHSLTGIDIHPGAKIGKSFFIDHGTGIVIGETCIIGDNVRLYQGVTLGALSLSKGRRLKSVKRHPTIQDNVTIYSNASIFGGETVIGENSTIGANVYLTKSVDRDSVVFLSDKGITFSKKNTKKGQH